MTNVNDVVALEPRGTITVVRVDNPPVNVLNRSVRDGLYEALLHVSKDDHVQGVVLACAGRTFIAGADIREFSQPTEGRSLPELINALENARKPIIAALHGAALGAGLELAMACHYRVAQVCARCGLPEVKLGLVPGAGGTQRLPRLIGVPRALELMVTGEPIRAPEALQLGLIDATYESDLERHALHFAHEVRNKRLALRRARDMHAKLSLGTPELFAAFRKAHAKKLRGSVVPEKIVQCVEAAVFLPFDEGLRFERETFTSLRKSPESKAQRYNFFGEREAAKIPDISLHVSERPIRKIGVVGAGAMGGGIAMNFLNLGVPVVLVEAHAQALERGVATLRKSYERSASHGKLTQTELERRLQLLSPTLDLQDVADCDLTIESVFEDLTVKKNLFTQLDDFVKPGAILATSTSDLDVNDIAASTSRPADVLGLHFFSPAEVMKLVEVVRGQATSRDVIATAMSLAKRLGKVPALVGVCRGFVGNRMLAARQEQAEQLILEGVMPWDVDRVLESFGMPMGPFAMSDLAGLDRGWTPERSRGDRALRHKLCELGRLGQKTGAGYYNYDPKTHERSIAPGMAALVAEYAHNSGRPTRARTIEDREILERCQYAVVNEGAKILEEGIALRASDIDVIWVNGYGWPTYHGGPMFWADSVGLQDIVRSLRHYELQLGPSWRPAERLLALAEQGKNFTR